MLVAKNAKVSPEDLALDVVVVWVKNIKYWLKILCFTYLYV